MQFLNVKNGFIKGNRLYKPVWPCVEYSSPFPLPDND